MLSKSLRFRHSLKGNELLGNKLNITLQKLQPHFSLKYVDAYDDSAVILKWSNQELQVSHDDMAQYTFLGGNFSSELESFSGGMFNIFPKLNCFHFQVNGQVNSWPKGFLNAIHFIRPSRQKAINHKKCLTKLLVLGMNVYLFVSR